MASNLHTGQLASSHVLLESIGVANTGDPRKDIDFFRVMPDSTLSPVGPAGFRVPKGRVLVVTDVDWQYGSGEPAGTQTFRIMIQKLSDPTLSRRVFESTVQLNAAGNGGISEAMTTGFVVSALTRLAVDASPGGGKIQHVLLRGYLAPDE